MCIYSKHSTWHIYEADDKKRRERIASMIFKKYISFKHLKLECRKKNTVKKLYFNNIIFFNNDTSEFRKRNLLRPKQDYTSSYKESLGGK